MSDVEAVSKPTTLSEESSINLFDAFSLDAPDNEHIPEISPQEEPNSPTENQKKSSSGADKNISSESETNTIQSAHDSEHDIILNSDINITQLKYKNLKIIKNI